MIASLDETRSTGQPTPVRQMPDRLGLGVTPPEEDPVAGDSDEVFLFPATLGQRRFWLLDQLVPGGNPALNVPLALRLRGRLDHAALERTFNEIVRRHETLRTTFHSEHGQLFQVIAPALTISVPMVDVQDFPAAERVQVPAHLMSEEMSRPFDLTHGPLLRARLVRLAPDHHLLLFPLHHIVSDGWSNGVLAREMGAIYGAFAQGKPSPLPDLTLQFADFALWQRSWVDSPAGANGFPASCPSSTCRSTARARRGGDRPRQGDCGHGGCRRSLPPPSRRWPCARGPVPSWCCWRCSQRCSADTVAGRRMC